MIIRPYVLPNGGLNGVFGITLLTDSIVFPDGSTISLSSFCDHQHLINRAVRGTIPEKLYVAHDIEQQSMLFVEEDDEAVVLGPKGGKKYDVYALSDQFFLKITMPRLNILTQERDEGEVFLNLGRADENIGIQPTQPDFSTGGMCIGSIDWSAPRVICSGWYVYGTGFTYHLTSPSKSIDTRTFVPPPTIRKAGGVFSWGSEYFTIEDGKIVKESPYRYGRHSGAIFHSFIACTVTTEDESATYLII